MADTMPASNGKHDVWTHRLAVFGIVLFMTVDIIATAALAAFGKEIPPALPAVAFTCITVLASLIHAIMKGDSDRVGTTPPPASQPSPLSPRTPLP
jgi:hypothetical protein